MRQIGDKIKYRGYEDRYYIITGERGGFWIVDSHYLDGSLRGKGYYWDKESCIKYSIPLFNPDTEWDEENYRESDV